MSTIKLPPLPPIPDEIMIDEGIGDCGHSFGQDEDALRAWATAYAEESVRQALAAQVPPILSTVLEQMWEWATGEGPAPRWQDIDDARRAFQQAQNSPENNHGEST